MRIAIVNDLLIAVEALRRVVATIPQYELAWVARDGAEAVAKCALDTPDLILMDLLMPVMDGVEATRRIMAQSPCAILMVTASVKGLAAQVFEAMGYGALDAINTPILGSEGQADNGVGLLRKIATIGKLLGKFPCKATASAVGRSPQLATQQASALVVIGASTGGPQALAAILARLPSDFPAAIVIVQHVDVQFAPGLVEWLNPQTPLSVEVARVDVRPEPGKVLIAATRDHLVLQPRLTLGYTQNPQDCSYRPSVDVFFTSVAKYWPTQSVGILLTGMGRDGAAGLQQLRLAGWHTIAQDRASSVVYGMPKAAAELGAAVEILPLQAIAPACLERVTRPSAKRSSPFR